MTKYFKVENERIYELPADVVERKKGTYHESKEKDEWWCHYYICDECGHTWVGGRNLCPNCGVDLRKVVNGD